MSDEKPNPVLEKMMGRRTVALSGTITQDSMTEVGKRLLNLQAISAEPINLLMDSGGGDIYAALKLCDMMNFLLSAPVTGIAVGECGSAATVIMLHCTKRAATPHSRFLVHSGNKHGLSFCVNEAGAKEIEHLLKEMKAVEERVLKIYRNKLTPAVWREREPSHEERKDFVRQLVSRGDQRFDKWLTVEEAIAVGLIQQIVPDKLDIFSQ